MEIPYRNRMRLRNIPGAKEVIIESEFVIKNPEESYIYLILPVNFTTVS